MLFFFVSLNKRSQLELVYLRTKFAVFRLQRFPFSLLAVVDKRVNRIIWQILKPSKERISGITVQVTKRYVVANKDRLQNS